MITIGFCLCLVALVPELIKARCLFNVTITTNGKKMPLILSNNLDKFMIPVGGKISMEDGKHIVLACPNNNTLKLTNTESAAAKCLSLDSLKLRNDVEARFESIECTKAIRGKPIKTNRPCGNNKGKIIEIGFQLSRQFLKLIEICYDEINGNNLYSTSLLYGNEQKYAAKSSDRPCFSTAGLGQNIPASVAYKKNIQKNTFVVLLGTSHLAEQYINNRSYLARGHMAPHADFIFAPWQYATYSYFNAAPQWQVINNGNWKALEFLARTAIENLDEHMEVYTGQYQVLTVLNAANQPTELYLTKNRTIAVPKFVWKILYSTKSRRAIAFVNLNNPFAERIDYICKDVCKQTGWFVPSFNEFSKGFIYCCNAKNLLNVVGTGPRLSISGVLPGFYTVSTTMQERLRNSDDEHDC